MTAAPIRLGLVAALLLTPAGWRAAGATQQLPPSPRFLALFHDYRRGDADTAIQAFSEWDDVDVRAEARLVVADEDDVWAEAALAAFHTESAMRGARFARFGDKSPPAPNVGGWGLESFFEMHAVAAQRIVQDLARVAARRHDDRLLAFCRNWYIAALSYCVRFRLPFAAEGLYSLANHAFSEDPEMRLLFGSLAEAEAGPFTPTMSTRCGMPHYFDGPDGCILNGPAAHDDTRFPKGKQEALWGFRSALRLNPSLNEAHLRLGRMLHLVGQNVEAREHLELALAQAKDEQQPFLAYMAAMFLGELDTHEDHLAAAITRYREAVAAEPGAHTAHVALGEALLRAGDRNGWLEAQKMFEGETRRTPAPLDPWFFYRYAQYWQVPARLKTMRESVRQGE